MANQNTRTFALEGNYCSGCAAKIEDRISKLEGVEQAVIQYATSKLMIELKESHISQENEIINKSVKIVQALEPGVKVIPEEISKINKNKNPKACSCDHDHEHSHQHVESSKKEVIKLAIGLIILIAATMLKLPGYFNVAMYVLAYAVVGYEVVTRAIKNILRGEIFDENFLMVIATIGAFIIGEYPEGVAVMIFYQLGELFQSMAVNRSRKSISELMDIRPDYANIVKGDEVLRVSPQKVEIDDIILVKPGEKVPLDGVIIEGETMFDTSALTGESVPRIFRVSDEVLSGVINKNKIVKIKVTKSFEQSTVSKILELVQNSSSKKAQTEKFITKFAKYYTPIVVTVAFLLAIVPPLIIEGATFSEWIHRGLIFLVVSCPCALVISVPLGYFGGIGAASRNGILVKGGNYLEALTYVDTIVFDKTGTLTKGIFSVTEINNEKWIEKEKLIEITAFAESYSSHPIATSIINKYDKKIDSGKVSNLEEIAGQGIKCSIENKVVLVGNFKLMKQQGVDCKQLGASGTLVYVAIDKKYAGCIVISDEEKEDAKFAIEGLKENGIKQTIMLTGDNENIAKVVARKIGIDKYYAGLLPADKVLRIEGIQENQKLKSKVMFVGDGINDAPVLARADIGVAMGGVGSDAAIEAADIVLMTDEPSRIIDSIIIAKKTKLIIWQNITFALVVKFGVLILTALGHSNMWEAVFADVGVAILAVLNAMRILKIKTR